MQPGGIGAVIRAFQVIIQGTNGGLWVFDGSGHLRESITATAGTINGQAYQPDIVSYSSATVTRWCRLSSGGLIFTDSLHYGSDGTVGLSPFGNNTQSPSLQLGAPEGFTGGLPGFAEILGPSPDNSRGGGYAFNTTANLLSNFGVFWLIPSGDTLGAQDVAHINNAYADGWQFIILMPGDWYLNANILIPNDHCDLHGCGSATVIHLVANAGTLVNMIMNTVDVKYFRFSDFIIDGNAGAQVANSWNCGIVLQNPSADGRHMGWRVRIQNIAGDGLVQTGRGSSSFGDFHIFGAGGFGLNVHEDCYFVNFDIGACGIDGILEQGSSNQFAACKSWFSGANLVSGRGDPVSLLTVNAPNNFWDGGGIAGLQFSLVNGWGNGHRVANISGSVIANAGSGGTLDCYYQDNARAGYCNINGSQRRVGTVVADSNNNCGNSGGVPNGNYPGIDLASSNCKIDGSSFDRAANANHQAAALGITSGANSNSIHLTFTGTLNDGSNMPPLTAASVPVKSDLSFKGEGDSFFNPVFAATYTPDPFGSTYHGMVVTGAITIANPALAGTNNTGYNAPFFTYPGMHLIIALTQDLVGGHVITLGAGYSLNGHAFTVAAANTSAIEFVFDGQLWQAIG
jgi:hypothetical protein